MRYHITRTYWDGEKWTVQDVPHTYTYNEELAYELCDIFRRMALDSGESPTDVLYMVHGE